MNMPGYTPVESLLIHGPVFKTGNIFAVKLTLLLADGHEVPYILTSTRKKDVIPNAYAWSVKATEKRFEVRASASGDVDSTHTW